MFQGIYVALPTPFTGSGGVDEAAFTAQVERLLAAGVHGLVPTGTTGESPTLTNDEKKLLWKICVKLADGRAQVVVGAGTYDTAASVAATRMAADVGADGVLAVVPYYNKPMQHGLVAHFGSIAQIGVPVMIYNIPGRTARNMETAAILAAAEHPTIKAVKEASGGVAVTEELKRAKPQLNVLSGDDALLLPSLAVGGDGVVSVAANVDPARMIALWEAWQAGDTRRALAINQDLAPLYGALFAETNPIPVKAALMLQGHGTTEMRLPMTSAVDATVVKLRAVMDRLGLLKG
ncbi:MAG TPA: 4-hydroxy-tetrahydrodipicolinate synthase [bacterium]|nr:4-hydroxy-tetrahydrodipicolinate synthase [bacterium]